MKKIIVLFLCFVMAGCGCSLSKGDKVIHVESGRAGTIEVVNGKALEDCQVAVRLEDDTFYYWVYAFKFDKIESN